MSEDSLNREPIELVEIVLPRCANVFGSAPCTATGRPCYNTRATCQDPDNYRDTPDRHLTPDLTLTAGDTIASGDLDRATDVFAGFDVRFGASPAGVIWRQGGTGTGVYLGVDGGNLVFEVRSSGTGTISVDAAQFAGKSMTIYIEIDFAVSATTATRLWVFDRVEVTATLLGSASWTAGGTWASVETGSIGGAGGLATINSRDDSDWLGAVTTARMYDSTAAPADMTGTFKSDLWLGRGVRGEPRDEKYILPCLTDLGAIGSRINLAGSDDNYKPLGRRATLDFTVSDFTHSDITQDPYLADRAEDPASVSTFWRKWLVRQKFGRIGALVRVHDGYAGQRLSDYKTRAYVLDKVDRNEDGAAFHCRDVLSRTEFLKAQVPAPSSGILAAGISSGATSLAVAGDVRADYPASGTLRINDEVMTYTSRSFGGASTTFAGLARGTDGSQATSHTAGDLVQICRRYVGASIPDVLDEWLYSDAAIPGQFVDASRISDEQDLYLNSYRLTSLVTEPTGIDELLGKLSQECGFYIWWDERAQKISLRAIRATAPSDAIVEWTHEANIVGNSMRTEERPKQRLNVLTVYYSPRDYAGDLGKPANFRAGLKTVNGETSEPQQYGDVVQTREIFSLFLTTEAQVNQTSARYILRFADVPTYAEFYVDAKDRSRWLGDIITISHPDFVDEFGARDVRRWLIVEAEEVDPGHLVRYVCADITLDGEMYFVTENGLGTYTAALFEARNAFVTDADGLNTDGTIGARIS